MNMEHLVRIVDDRGNHFLLNMKKFICARVEESQSLPYKQVYIIVSMSGANELILHFKANKRAHEVIDGMIEMKEL